MKRRLLHWRTFLKSAGVAGLMLSLASSGLDAQTITVVGTKNGSNGDYNYPCPLQDNYSAQRAQYLYTEAELNAAGIMAGAIINSIGWEVTPTYNASSTNAPIEMEDYSIALDTTLITSLTDTYWETGAISFYGPTTYSYAALNTYGPGGYITFPGSFVYDGGNLLVEVCSGLPTGDYTLNPSCSWTTGLSFNGSHTFRDDNITGCGIASLTNTGDQSKRPRLVVNFTSATSCSGVPIAGTVNAPSDVCNNQPFMLSLNGATVAGGISYQWEESPVGMNTWTTISNATNSTVQIILSGSKDYRCTLLCGSSSVSTSPVTVNERGFYMCYCSPAVGSMLASQWGANFVTKVTIQNTSLSNSNPSVNNTGYTLFSPGLPGNTVTLYPGVSYTLTANAQNNTGLNQAGAWIDFDRDGLMDNTSEFIALSNNIFHASGTFTVPSTAVAGLTGLRVRINDNGYTYGGVNQGSCSNDLTGETEEYIITIGTISNCSGQPAHATASGPSMVCSGIDFNIEAAGMTIGNGIIYDWQYNNGSGWFSTGGTNTIYPVAGGITIPTSYRLVTNCVLSNSSDTSNIIVIGTKPFYECYCSPLNGTALSTQGSNNYIDHVEVVGSSLSSSTTAAGPGGYSQYDPSTPNYTTTLIPNFTYTIRATIRNNDQWVMNHSGSWIDFDGDGLFDNTTEFVALTNNLNNVSGSFTVPATTFPGMKGLRIRVNSNGFDYGGTNLDACDDDNYGETEDYIINIPAPTNCSGQPTHVTVSGPSTVCSNVDFNIVATGMTTGTGISYDWQSNTGSGWASTGSTTNTHSAIGGIATPTSYRFVTHCSTSNQYDTSNIITMGINPFYLCYCSPLNGPLLSGQGNDNLITDVAIVNTNLTNPTSTTTITGYTQYNPPTPNQTATLYPGFTYSISSEVLNNSNWYKDHSGAWIDFNGDGVFDNTGEFIAFTNNSNNVSGSFTVPMTAVAGMIGLRIRVNSSGHDYGGTGLDACDDDDYGETEDYVVMIATLSNCSGQPANAIITGPATSCPNVDFSLTATGMTTGVGIIYDWQSNDGTGWASTGSTNNTHNAIGGIVVPTSYRLVTQCILSNQFDTSNIVVVGISPFYICYCSPLNGTTLSGQGNDNYITSVEVLNTSLNNPTFFTNANGYSQYNPSIPNQTTVLNPGFSYTIRATESNNSNWIMDHSGAWIDFDADGVFDNTAEFIAFTNNGNNFSCSFTIPPTAVPGMTGLRIRVNANGSNYGGTNLDACANDGYGETEDYIITIPALANCNGQPAHATVSGPATTCPNVDFSLAATGITVALGISYDWQSNDGAGWTSTSVAGNIYTTTGGISIPTSYRLITYCILSNQYDTSNVVTVGISPFYACYCSPTTGTALSGLGSSYNYNFINNVRILNTSLNNSTITPTGSGYSQYDPSVPNLTTTLSPGFTYTIDATITNNDNWVMDHSGVWIDFDRDGLFDNTTEFITLTNNGNSISGTFTVPVTAVAGMTGLRMRVNSSGFDYGGAHLNACDDDDYGETEDYIITIPVLTNCSGLPTHSNVTGPAAVCPNVGFNLTATGMTVALGASYDWQSNNGSGWITTGAVSNVYNLSSGIAVATSYRLVTHCSISNQYDTSNVFVVGISPFYACYCSPLTGFTLSGNYTANYVSGVNIHGTPLNNAPSTYDFSGYSQFIPSALNTTAILLQNNTYTIDVATMWQYDAGAWIDYNGDGSFDNTTEFITLTYNVSGDTASGTFMIPVTATAGTTGLRIRANTQSYIYGGTNQGPCGDDDGGETEDYAITIGALPTCPFPTILSATNITTNSASISWTSTATQHEIEYKQGGSFPIGTGNRIAVSGNPQTISLSPGTLYSYYVRAICGPGDTSVWTMGNSFYTICGPINFFPWMDDVEGQPINYGNGQMINCWNAAPTPSGWDYEWYVGSGSIGNNNSGPQASNSGNRCFYTESWNGSSGDIAQLTSPEFDVTTVPSPQLQFYYHMYGATIGKLVTEIFDGTSWNRVDSIVGQQQTSKSAPWQLRTIPLTGFQGIIQVRFEATRGNSFTGFIALDDLTISGAPLAVKLDKISATDLGTSNRVDWNTLSEDEGDMFELQRSSNGKEFRKLDLVKAKGEASRYTYMDNSPAQGYNYYRLLLKYVNGENEYSEIVKAFVKSSGFSVDAYPNPVSDNLTISVKGVQGSNANIQLSDVSGKVLKTISMKSNHIMINMSGLANGLYIIKYTDEDHTQTMKINKQ